MDMFGVFAPTLPSFPPEPRTTRGSRIRYHSAVTVPEPELATVFVNSTQMADGPCQPGRCTYGKQL